MRLWWKVLFKPPTAGEYTVIVTSPVKDASGAIIGTATLRINAEALWAYLDNAKLSGRSTVALTLGALPLAAGCEWICRGNDPHAGAEGRKNLPGRLPSLVHSRAVGSVR